jgi:hypothetical protein
LDFIEKRRQSLVFCLPAEHRCAGEVLERSSKKMRSDIKRSRKIKKKDIKKLGCGLDDLGIGVHFPAGQDIFLSTSRLPLGLTQPPIQWLPGIKWPGCEANRSRPPSSSEFKNGGAIPLIPHTSS